MDAEKFKFQQPFAYNANFEPESLKNPIFCRIIGEKFKFCWENTNFNQRIEGKMSIASNNRRKNENLVL